MKNGKSQAKKPTADKPKVLNVKAAKPAKWLTGRSRNSTKRQAGGAGQRHPGLPGSSDNGRSGDPKTSLVLGQMVGFGYR